MDRDAVMRRALTIGAFFNFGAAALIAFPMSLGQIAGLPTPVSPLYTTLLAFFVALFGAAYAWLARQPVIDRPLVAVAAVGKTGVFLAAVTLYLADVASVRTVVLATGDLIFAAIFVWWLLGTERTPDT